MSIFWPSAAVSHSPSGGVSFNPNVTLVDEDGFVETRQMNFDGSVSWFDAAEYEEEEEVSLHLLDDEGDDHQAFLDCLESELSASKNVVSDDELLSSTYFETDIREFNNLSESLQFEDFDLFAAKSGEAENMNERSFSLDEIMGQKSMDKLNTSLGSDEMIAGEATAAAAATETEGGLFANAFLRRAQNYLQNKNDDNDNNNSLDTRNQEQVPGDSTSAQFSSSANMSHSQNLAVTWVPQKALSYVDSGSLYFLFMLR
jgi:hypothetical protein